MLHILGNLTVNIINLCINIGEINKVPTVFYHYPDKNGVIIDDNEFPGNPKISSEEISNLFIFLKNLLKESENINERNYSLFNNKFVNHEFSKQLNLADEKI